MSRKLIYVAVACLATVGGCLLRSHLEYSARAEAARVLPKGVLARPGRIYFASFPENNLAFSIFGWRPNIGHAALVTKDASGTVKQYDYGWFVGAGGGVPNDAIGFTGSDPSFGIVRRKIFPQGASDDAGVARMVLKGMPGYGGKIELRACDVDDVGIAERYMELLAADEKRSSMAWRCWQIGGLRCGNVTRQAFDAARGEGHALDLLWGGFPGADAPIIGTSFNCLIF